MGGDYGWAWQPAQAGVGRQAPARSLDKLVSKPSNDYQQALLSVLAACAPVLWWSAHLPEEGLQPALLRLLGRLHASRRRRCTRQAGGADGGAVGDCWSCMHTELH